MITLHNGRSFGVVRQGLALRRRSLYDRLRAIAEYPYNRRPSVVLVLVPSPWEQRLTDEFCLNADLRDGYVGGGRAPGDPRRVGPPGLAFLQLGGGQDLPHPGAGGLPGRPRRQVPLGNAGARAGLAAQPGANGPVCSGFRRQPC